MISCHNRHTHAKLFHFYFKNPHTAQFVLKSIQIFVFHGVSIVIKRHACLKIEICHKRNIIKPGELHAFAGFKHFRTNITNSVLTGTTLVIA